MSSRELSLFGAIQWTKRKLLRKVSPRQALSPVSSARKSKRRSLEKPAEETVAVACVSEAADEEEIQYNEIPRRPEDGTYLARLWDNMYKDQVATASKSSKRKSLLAKDVKQKLKKGENVKELLATVESILG